MTEQHPTAPASSFPTLVSVVGNTPIVQLKVPTDIGEPLPAVELLAKLEYLNPFGAATDRVARYLVGKLPPPAQAAQNGRTVGASTTSAPLPGDGHTAQSTTLVVPSSGNLAISLATLTVPLGYRVTAVIPERTSKDRITLLKALDVEIVRVSDHVLPSAPESCISVARQLATETPGAILVDLASGTFSVDDVYREMAEEILAQCSGRLDVLVVGVESGGTITGLAHHLKRTLPALRVVGVEPTASFIREGAQAMSGHSNDNTGTVTTRSALISQQWKLEDLGGHAVPPALDPAAVDAWIPVNDTMAYSTARRLVRAGYLAGVSSGAVVAAVHAYARTAMKAGERALAILSDTARNYGSTLLADEWLLNHDLMDAPLARQLHYQLVNKYRGASVEDLQLPAAVSIAPSDLVSTALDIMMERDYSQLPVITHHRKLVGYITLTTLQSLLDVGRADLRQPVEDVMYRFRTLPAHGQARSSNAGQQPDGDASLAPPHTPTGAMQRQQQPRYELITPSTPLNELARFFEHHSVAFVTDSSRKFCLGVVTKLDLMKFISRREGVGSNEPFNL
ncbi:hypothetical protein IWQ60_003027 [Tieghemiomyces parasiticus]|uniref:CBS domain-containing protein n=1 Tax=Tieghemiomyces parasiticus TaxID=78921 RepID=A0A9W8E0F8_9FUNG|nr:hypothetical protein IWQ60_003027 [Tieghemiomyces parasiticus]